MAPKIVAGVPGGERADYGQVVRQTLEGASRQDAVECRPLLP